MHLALAPFTLRAGVSEETLLATSDDFDASFVKKQDGILRRILVRDGEGGYADLVFFEDEQAIERVLEAEQNSEVCATFFSIMDDDGSHRVFEVLKHTTDGQPARPAQGPTFQPRQGRPDRSRARQIPTNV